MKNFKTLDQRGVFHWHAFIMLAVVISVGYLGANRIIATNAASSSADDALAGNFATCTDRLDKQLGKKSLDKNREKALIYVKNRQTKAATFIDVNGKTGLIHKLYGTDTNKKLAKQLDGLSAGQKASAKQLLASQRSMLEDRIGGVGATGNNLNGRLNAYEAAIKKADSKSQLQISVCSMMAELRVYSFWPTYIKMTNQLDTTAVDYAKLDDLYAKAANGAQQTEALSILRGDITSAQKDQASYSQEIANLKPTSIGNSADFASFFKPYQSRVKFYSNHADSLEKRIKKVAKASPKNSSAEAKANANRAQAEAKEAERKALAEAKADKVSLTSPKLPPNFDRKNKDAKGYYKLPRSPDNQVYYFYGYGSNTGNGDATYPYQRYGKGGLIRVFYTVALSFHQKYPEAKLVAGDLNALDGHVSHRNGVDMDVYVNDHKGADMRPAYRNANTVERSVILGKMFMQTKKIDLIFYNDSEVANKVNAYAKAHKLPGRMVSSNSSHEFHMHIRLKESKGPLATCATANAAKGCFPSVDNDPPTDGRGTSSD